MKDIGKPHDHGMPPEVEVDPDLIALREAAEYVAAALEKVWGTEIDGALDIVYPLLSVAGEKLRRLILRHMEAREETQNVN